MPERQIGETTGWSGPLWYLGEAWSKYSWNTFLGIWRTRWLGNTWHRFTKGKSVLTNLRGEQWTSCTLTSAGLSTFYHNILVSEVGCYSPDGSRTRWVKSCFDSWVWSIVINGMCSVWMLLTSGVLEGVYPGSCPVKHLYRWPGGGNVILTHQVCTLYRVGRTSWYTLRATDCSPEGEAGGMGQQKYDKI